jgi:GMP synthase (glutamine-hydrolysing)
MEKQEKYKIAVIDPSIISPELDALNLIAGISPLPLSYHLPGLFGLDSMKTLEDNPISGIILLGSASSVHDKLPWQSALADWLRPCILSAIPIFGICFGHQMIAHMLGGQVGFARADRKKLTGTRRVVFSPDRLWGNQQEGLLCVSHAEAVLQAPDCMNVVGRSEDITIDAAAHKTLPIWTYQTHPEATTSFFSRRKMGSFPPEAFSFGHGLVKRFLDFVAAGKTHGG